MRLCENFINALLLTLIVLIPLSCGSSGGGSEQEEPQTSFTQSQVDLPDPVLIKQANAETIVRDAYSGGAFASEMSSILGKSKGGKKIDDPFVDFITDSIKKYLAPAPSSKSTVSETWYDNCDGECHVSATETSSTTLSMTMDMNNYHSGNDCTGLGMSGQITVNAIFRNLADGNIDITSMIMRFHDTQVTAYGITMTLGGSMVMESSSQGDWMEMDMTMINTTENINLFFSDYVMDSAPSGLNQTLNGGYGNSGYGSVTISTLGTLYFDYNEPYPYQGGMIFTGSGNSSVRLTCIDSDTFYLECDSDGDGMYEWNSEDLYW